MLQKGQVVRALAGRDAGGFFVVTDVDDNGYVFIADGRRRKLTSPKRKNPRHIAETRQTLPPGSYPTDRALRRLLNTLSE